MSEVPVEGPNGTAAPAASRIAASSTAEGERTGSAAKPHHCSSGTRSSPCLAAKPATTEAISSRNVASECGGVKVAWKVAEATAGTVNVVSGQSSATTAH